MLPSLSVPVAIFPIYTRDGWEPANYCCEDVTPTAGKSRLKFSKDIGDERLIRRAPMIPRTSRGLLILSTLRSCSRRRYTWTSRRYVCSSCGSRQALPWLLFCFGNEFWGSAFPLGAR